ncbi:MAG: TonB-dependent receptor [Gammaproteobacteria bacterium]|nr:TonB-dependent receptor [Gammaproteobacteria bacterium]
MPAVQLEAIVVAGGPVVIDFTTTANGARLGQQEFELIPSDRSFRDLLRVMPHTYESTHGDGINVNGSTGIENMYFVDGINTTDPYLAATSTELPYNFVQEIQLLSGGYEAEFGRSLGGIVNVVTRSGGNEFHGSVFGYFNNHSLTAEERLGIGGRQSRGANVYDFGFALGGPVVRERLWFFAAYDPTFRNADIEIDRFGFFEEKGTDHLFAGKLTWSPQQNTRAVLSVLGDISRADRVHPGPFTNPDSLVNPGALLNRFEDGGVSTSLVVTRDIAGQWLVNASLGYQYRNLYDGPRAGDDSARATEVVPINLTQAIQVFSGGFGEWIDADNSRFSAKLSATRFLADHTLKAGLEWEATATDERNGNTSPGVIIINLIVPDDPAACQNNPFFFTCRHFAIFLEPVETDVSGRFPAAFIQDSWKATDRLTVNLGVRWDAQYWVGTDGQVAQRITDQWQPRTGFTYDLTGRGDHKLSGSFGRFYQQTALRLVSTRANGVDQNGFRFYDGDPRTGGQPVGEFVSCCSIEVERDGLRGSHFDEFSLGYESLFDDRYHIGVRGVYRTLRDAVQPGRCDQDPASPNACGPGGESGTGNPGRGILTYLDPVERVYRAVEFSLAIVGDRRYSLSANYVLSRNSGNYPGAHDQDQGNFFFPSNNRSYQFRSQMVNNNGPLPNDHSHAFKLWGSYQFARGFRGGGFFTVSSGVPISRLSLVQEIGLAPGFITPRGSEGRTPTIWDFDLRVSYTLQGSGARPRFTLDILNAGNTRGTLGVDNMFERFGGRDNPNWGRPRSHQDPRTVRLGVELLF